MSQKENSYQRNPLNRLAKQYAAGDRKQYVTGCSEVGCITMAANDAPNEMLREAKFLRVIVTA